jgi:hypothetical protein
MPPGDRCSVLDYLLEKEYPGYKRDKARFTVMKANAYMAARRRRERGE